MGNQIQRVSVMKDLEMKIALCVVREHTAKTANMIAQHANFMANLAEQLTRAHQWMQLARATLDGVVRSAACHRPLPCRRLKGFHLPKFGRHSQMPMTTPFLFSATT